MQKSPMKIKPDIIEGIKDKTRAVSKKKKKNKKVIAPKFEIGDEIVIGTEPYSKSRSADKYYLLVEVIDFSLEGVWKDDFIYYAIVKETTKEGYDRIGRLVHFRAKEGYQFGTYRVMNVCATDMKWVK